MLERRSVAQVFSLGEPNVLVDAWAKAQMTLVILKSIHNQFQSVSFSCYYCGDGLVKMFHLRDCASTVM
jgi:hypothetical protein